MEKELWKGNEAVAEAAIRAGCKYFFGYPITPQNEIPEYLSLHLPKIGGCFLQAESEVAAINMIYSSTITIALYFSARAWILSRGQTFPSIENTPSVTITLYLWA